jgi:hypothetical protein
VTLNWSLHSGTGFFLWKRPAKNELQQDFQDAHVFGPRRGLLLEGQMQTESAIGVRLKIIGRTERSAGSAATEFPKTNISTGPELTEFHPGLTKVMKITGPIQ